MKLVVDPHPSTRPKEGRDFTVEVTYSGTPEAITDADTSIEGWIRACYPLAAPQTCDGAFVVNEPIGAQSWFPSNNYPTDKATFDTLIRVPQGKTALGVGENVGNIDNGDGTVTWRWREDDPTATYLTTATVGDFNYTVDSMTETSTGRTLPVYNAVDSTATPAQAAAIQDRVEPGSGPAQLPQRPVRALPVRLQRRGRRPGGRRRLRPRGAGQAALLGRLHLRQPVDQPRHPAARVGPPVVRQQRHARDLGGHLVQRGLGELERVVLELPGAGRRRTRLLSSTTSMPTPRPRTGRSPRPSSTAIRRTCSTFFPTYERGAMTLQGYREIVGDAKFFALANDLLDEYRYGNISTQEFIAEAKKASGLKGAKLNLLDQYFQQWLYGETKPTILPENFA